MARETLCNVGSGPSISQLQGVTSRPTLRDVWQPHCNLGVKMKQFSETDDRNAVSLATGTSFTGIRTSLSIWATVK